MCEISSEFIEKWLFYKDFRFFHLLSYRVRCTINRSHSTPCKKAEFEHLQTFPGHCLDFFLSVSGKICHSPIKKVKRQPTLIISFSQYSPFFGEQSKNPGWNPTRVRRYLGSAPGSLWQNSPHKDAFFYISLTNIDQCWITIKHNFTIEGKQPKPRFGCLNETVLLNTQIVCSHGNKRKVRSPKSRQRRATNGLQALCYLNGLSLVGRWWPDVVC